MTRLNYDAKVDIYKQMRSWGYQNSVNGIFDTANTYGKLVDQFDVQVTIFYDTEKDIEIFLSVVDKDIEVDEDETPSTILEFTAKVSYDYISHIEEIVTKLIQGFRYIFKYTEDLK